MLNLLIIILHATRDEPLTRDRSPVARQGEPPNGPDTPACAKRAQPETGPRPEEIGLSYGR